MVNATVTTRSAACPALLPWPELPAQRAAGQGHRAVPAHRRAGQETFETRSRWATCSAAAAVDRAIRLHQGLVSRHDLSDAQRVQALLALGEDYMKSGLLDRAETVFTELAQLDQRAPQSLKHLIGIYQAERDWERRSTTRPVSRTSPASRWAS